MDTELFGLCEEVYALFPDWDDKKLGGFMKDVYPGENPMGIFETKEVLESKYMKYICPVYNSDYLLEKLPKEIGDYGLTLDYSYSKWTAQYTDGYYVNMPGNFAIGGTPLKALLRLTLTLHEAGELK